MMVLAVLVTAQVLTVANSNLIAIALPQLSVELGASAAQREWIVDAYVLVFAALLLTGCGSGDPTCGELPPGAVTCACSARSDAEPADIGG